MLFRLSPRYRLALQDKIYFNIILHLTPLKSLHSVFRHTEPEAYPLHNSTSWIYHSYKLDLPNATANEFLIEKSPQYSQQFRKRYFMQSGTPQWKEQCDKRATFKTAQDIKVSLKVWIIGYYNKHYRN